MTRHSRSCKECGFVTDQDDVSCPRCMTPLLDIHDEMDRRAESAGSEVDQFGDGTEKSASDSHGVWAPGHNLNQDVGSRNETSSIPSSSHFQITDEVTEAIEIEYKPLNHKPKLRGLFFVLFAPFGRIGRLAYLLSVLLAIAFYATSFLVGISLMPLSTDENAGSSLATILTVAAFALLLPASIKRLHDFNSTGWGVLSIFFCGVFVVPIISMIEGAKGRNEHGRPTHMKWNIFSAATVATMLLCGSYSASMLARLNAVENEYEEVYLEYENGPTNNTRRDLAEVYEDSLWCRRWCPFYSPSAAMEMYSAMACGQIEFERENWDDAANWLQKSIEASKLLQNVSMASDVESGIQADLVSIRLTFADALEAAGKLEQAKKERAAIAEGIADPNVAGRLDKTTELETRGIVHLEQEQFEKAESTFAELIEMGQTRLNSVPDDSQSRSLLGGYFHNRALARFNLGNLDGAQADLRRAIELQTAVFNVDSEMAAGGLCQHHELLGQLFEERKDIDAALKEYEAACKVDPKSVTLRARLANIRYERLEFEKIAVLLDDFLIDIKNVSLEYMLAVSLLQDKRANKAARIIERLQQRHPESLEAQFLHGVSRMIRNEYEAAVDSLEKAYQQNPRDPAILFNLAVSLARIDRTPQAQQIVAELSALHGALAARVRRWLQMNDNSQDIEPLFELFYNR